GGITSTAVTRGNGMPGGRSTSMSLLQWRDRYGRLTPLQTIPVGQQLRLMVLAPFDDKRQHPRRQAALAERHRSDADQSVGAAVEGVEMRGQVIARVHLDHDSEEAGDLGHGRPIPPARLQELVPRLHSPAQENVDLQT